MSSPIVTMVPGLSGANLTWGTMQIEYAADGIVAKAGGGQTNATQLVAQSNRIATVATAGDSVKLPPAILGMYVTVQNDDAANNLQVFGSGSDSINDTAAATGIAQAPQSIQTYRCHQAGMWSVAGGAGYAGNLWAAVAQDSLVAHAGGTQAAALAITAQVVHVGTVATNADSIRLPASFPGLPIFLINHGAKDMQVYGAGTDTIDDVATATGVSQPANSVALYVSSKAGKWYTLGVGQGFTPTGLPMVSAQNALTAKAGGGQGAGPAINRIVNRVTTVTTAADSITLPLASAGGFLVIINDAAANSMNVFPGTGDQINALGANAAFALAAGKTAILFSAATTQWDAILTA